MAKRTDIHRPSAPGFDPEAYEYVGVIDLNPYEIRDADGRVEDVIDHSSIGDDEMQKLGERGYTPAAHYNIEYEITPEGMIETVYDHMHNCGHCGSHIRFAAVMAHESSMEFIVVGQDCLTNRFDEMSKADFKVLRDAAKKAARESKKAEQRADLIAEHPELTDAFESNNSFIQDVMWKFHKYAELSDRQIAAVKTALIRDAEWEAKKAAEYANNPAKDAPSGRVEVTGEILSIKLRETDFFSVFKMTIKTTDGWKLWVSLPSSLDEAEAEVGDTVSMRVTVTPSNDDPKFAFGKRPSKAVLVS